MPDIAQLKSLGEMLRLARKTKGWTLEDVEAHSGVSKNYVWILEEAYQQGTRSPTVPTDEKLSALADALGIATRDLHAALGRIPPGSPAAQLVREKLAAYNGEGKIAPEEVNDLSNEVEDFVNIRVDRIMRQAQERGKQLQKILE